MEVRKLGGMVLISDELVEDGAQSNWREFVELENLRITNPAEYERRMQARRDDWEAEERKRWLATPWYKRVYIVIGRWLRKVTLTPREWLIAWLSWDDIYDEDDE